MALTMTDEQERDIRKLVSVFDETPADSNEAALLAELDAERAAHGETIASLNQERSAHEATKAEVGRLMVALHGDGSSVPGAEDEIAALKARLALAEAVCESCEYLEGEVTFDYDKLEAWRAGK